MEISIWISYFPFANVQAMRVTEEEYRDVSDAFESRVFLGC